MRFVAGPGQRVVARLLVATAVVGTGVAGCGERQGREDAVASALRRSRAVMAATWSYGADTLPPERGSTAPRIVDRCRVALPGADAPLDVACGVIFLGLEPDADTAWIGRVVRGLGGEVVGRGRIPGWGSALGEAQPYLLMRVQTGTESRTLERAFHSEGVRFVDVRPVRRRRP